MKPCKCTGSSENFCILGLHNCLGYYKSGMVDVINHPSKVEDSAEFLFAWSNLGLWAP